MGLGEQALRGREPPVLAYVGGLGLLGGFGIGGILLEAFRVVVIGNIETTWITTKLRGRFSRNNLQAEQMRLRDLEKKYPDDLPMTEGQKREVAENQQFIEEAMKVAQELAHEYEADRQKGIVGFELTEPEDRGKHRSGDTSKSNMELKNFLTVLSIDIKASETKALLLESQLSGLGVSLVGMSQLKKTQAQLMDKLQKIGILELGLKSDPESQDPDGSKATELIIQAKELREKSDLEILRLSRKGQQINRNRPGMGSVVDEKLNELVKDSRSAAYGAQVLREAKRVCVHFQAALSRFVLFQA